MSWLVDKQFDSLMGNNNFCTRLLRPHIPDYNQWWFNGIVSDGVVMYAYAFYCKSITRQQGKVYVVRLRPPYTKRLWKLWSKYKRNKLITVYGKSMPANKETVKFIGKTIY